MSGRRGRKPIKVSTEPEPTRTYHVTRAGARQKIRAIPHLPEASAPSTPVLLAGPNEIRELEELNQLIEATFRDDVLPDTAPFHKPIEEENALAELELYTNEDASIVVKPRKPGEVYNAWSTRFIALTL
ncbi:hypothetical protein RSOLAG1IB_11365 [Rhizoctonia solani AG-1 IB]|uniref:Uncharacterized protein n=1 Tax=Thanatephorus cucumeris (strain AG1-IB / isolate 7/3/14) TaxID=1108050 RepID=A0A0B7FB56_THACB|nr:hypothetical protein RSOLAG1IB_11365 [Rhizoctonia solani AG-1 IB]